jgi:hypothetical protein
MDESKADEKLLGMIYPQAEADELSYASLDLFPRFCCIPHGVKSERTINHGMHTCTCILGISAFFEHGGRRFVGSFFLGMLFV